MRQKEPLIRRWKECRSPTHGGNVRGERPNLWKGVGGQSTTRPMLQMSPTSKIEVCLQGQFQLTRQLHLVHNTSYKDCRKDQACGKARWMEIARPQKCPKVRAATRGSLSNEMAISLIFCSFSEGIKDKQWCVSIKTPKCHFNCVGSHLHFHSLNSNPKTLKIRRVRDTHLH